MNRITLQFQAIAKNDRTRLRSPLLILAIYGLAQTCGCNNNGRVAVSPVRGKITYNGQGVPQTTVVFFRVDPPDEATKKLHPYAYGKDNGEFEAKTYVDGDGVPPGKYRVSIMAPSAGGESKKDKPVDVAASSGPGVRVPAAIAAKYSNVDTAGIEVEIHPGENNLEPFELTMGTGRATQAVSTTSSSTINAKN
jgi:hypothetical protein